MPFFAFMRMRFLRLAPVYYIALAFALPYGVNEGMHDKNIPWFVIRMLLIAGMVQSWSPFPFYDWNGPFLLSTRLV